MATAVAGKISQFFNFLPNFAYFLFITHWLVFVCQSLCNYLYNLLYNCEKMQLIDGMCQKHRPLVFLAGLLLVKEYITYVKFHTGCEI